MSKPIRILGIAGSLRRESYNRAALRAAVELAPEGVELETYEGIGEFPAFNQDLEKTPPEAVADFKGRIRAADAVLFVSPEYNYSIPGALKNAIDWASRPYGDSAWSGKVCAVMGASGGMLGTARMQYHLRQCFVFLDMHPLNKPEVMIANSAERFDKEGRLTDRKTRDKIKELLTALAKQARASAAS